jgi:hypothetical protein
MLHAAVAEMRAERRARWRASQPRELALSAVIHARGVTVAFPRREEEGEGWWWGGKSDADMWAVAAPPWGNCSGSIWEEPSPEIMQVERCSACIRCIR